MTVEGGDVYMKFEDEGAVDTYIAMSRLTSDQAEKLRSKVKEEGYGERILLPEELR